MRSGEVGTRQKQHTIQDVARIAQVSTATVSRALSMPDKVSPATLERVNRAVQKLGYTRNVAAQSLRRRETKTLLVALPNVGNTFFAPIVDAIERTARERGYSILIVNRRGDAASDETLLSYYRSNRADGLLLFDGNADSRDWLDQTSSARLNFPIVNVCEQIPGVQIPVVQSENAKGAALAIRAIADLGHMTCGRITGPPTNVLTLQRGDGFAAAVDESGLSTRSEWVFEGDFSIAAGEQAAIAFSKLEERPTAMFCDADEIAIGFISACRSLGIDCPNDVSVIGFDDIKFAAQFYPPLSTIRQDKKELGRIAATQLIDILEGHEMMVPSVTTLPCSLVMRGSTGAPAA